MVVFMRLVGAILYQSKIIAIDERYLSKYLLTKYIKIFRRESIIMNKKPISSMHNEQRLFLFHSLEIIKGLEAVESEFLNNGRGGLPSTVKGSVKGSGKVKGSVPAKKAGVILNDEKNKFIPLDLTLN